MMTVPVVQFTVAGTPASGMGRPYTCVFDGHCKVCTRLTHLLRAWDTAERVEVVASQTPGVAARFPWIPMNAYAQALQLVGPGGHTWQGAAAIEQLLNILPAGALAAWIFKIPFARPIADRAYRWFARNRHHFGCGEHCQVRPPDVDFHES